jgi:hypothetical protein
MVIAGVADLVIAMRGGVIPAEVAYWRIVEVWKRGQKTVFGDAAQVAWRLMVLGAITSMDSGFGIDMKEKTRKEIIAVVEHFCYWCELTYDKIRQGHARGDDVTVYHDLDGELAAYAKEREGHVYEGKSCNVYLMLGDESIIRRNSGMLGAHSGRPTTPDFESVHHENGLEKAVMSIIKCAHMDGGHTKVHNLCKAALGPALIEGSAWSTPVGRVHLASATSCGPTL